MKTLYKIMKKFANDFVGGDALIDPEIELYAKR